MRPLPLRRSRPGIKRRVVFAFDYSFLDVTMRPQVLDDLLIVRGPIMGRVVPGGLFLRANPKEQAESTRLGKALGPGNGFEPLLVEEIAASDRMLFYWSACVFGKSPVGDDVLISRSLRNSTNERVHTFTSLPLELEDRGKGVSCQDMLESLPPNTSLCDTCGGRTGVRPPCVIVLRRGLLSRPEGKPDESPRRIGVARFPVGADAETLEHEERPDLDGRVVSSGAAVVDEVHLPEQL